MHTNQVSDGSSEIRDSFLDEIESIASATHAEPFHVLGPHWVERNGKPALAIRAFHPRARDMRVLWRHSAAPYPAKRIHPDGLFESLLPAETPGLIPGQAVNPTAYRLEFTFADGTRTQVYDPYAFPPSAERLRPTSARRRHSLLEL